MTGYLFHGGPIHTMAGDTGALEGRVLVTSGRQIAWVGPEASCPRELRRDSEPVDLAGRALLPGLCDAHLHLVLAAVDAADMDCRGASDPEALAALVRSGAARVPSGRWITGSGWERRTVFADREPRLGILDEAAPDHPVLLVSKDVHSAWMNGAALARMASLPGPPPSCTMHRDANGRPTGLVFEDILELRRRLVPPPTAAETPDLVEASIRRLHALGITAVHSNEPVGDLELYRSYLQDRDRPWVRALWNVVPPRPEEVGASFRRAVAQEVPERLGAGGVKLFLDGTFGSRTAALSEPYVGSDERGILVMDAAELRRWVAAIREVGTHAVVHVIGDRAVELAVSELRAVSWAPGTRHRLEHAQLLPESLLSGPPLDDLVVSAQPSHMWGDREIVEHHLPAGLWQRRAYLLRSAIERGALLVLGSDAPVEDPEVWRGVQAAVTRLEGDGRRPWNGAERLTVAEALTAHTAGPARIHGRCFATGVLAPGRLADLVALEPDPFAVDPASLRAGVRTAMTFLDGDPVFTA